MTSRLLLGDGQGALSYGSTLGGAVAGPSGIASGRLNDDANLDIVVAKELSEPPVKIGVFIGHGDGGVRARGRVRHGRQLRRRSCWRTSTAIASLDVATADLFGDTVSVRLGNGDGTFGDLHQTTVPGGPFGMAAGLLDDDDNLDLAVSLYDESKLATLIGQW